MKILRLIRDPHWQKKTKTKTYIHTCIYIYTYIHIYIYINVLWKTHILNLVPKINPLGSKDKKY